MPRDDEPREPEILYESKEDRAIASLEEVRRLLKENNALLKRVGPLLVKAEQAGLLDGTAGRPRTILDYAGKALVEGKFDGLIGAVEDVLTEGRAKRGNAPARRRRS